MFKMSMSRRNHGTKTTEETSSLSPEGNFALVKWLSGKEKGRFTHNVQVSWIQQFVHGVDFRDESYLVEWRVPPKPKAGWPVADAQLLEVSNDLDFLLQRMEEEMKQSNSDNEMNQNPFNLGSETPSSNGRRKVTSTPKSTSHGTQLKNNENIHKLFQAFLANVSGTANLSGTTTSTELVQPDENLVKVGDVLTLSKSAHMEAKLARTPSSMTMDLVRAAFSARRLKRSSYAGQKRIRNGEIFQKRSLKRYRKMKDIQNFVNQRFPYFTQSDFGHAVNACVGKNVDKHPKAKLVDQSESEESDGED